MDAHKRREPSAEGSAAQSRCDGPANPTAATPTPQASSVPALATVADQIQTEHKAAQRCASEAVAHAIRAGELLIEAKAALPHGAFGEWLAANVEFSDRTARGYMQLAGLDQAKRQRVADMSLREAMVAIADKREVIEGEYQTETPAGPQPIEWERPDGEWSFATWQAAGWDAVATVRENAIHPGHFDLMVLVGSNETTMRRPVRADAVGLALGIMGVPSDAAWNDYDGLDRYADQIEATP